MADSVYRRFTQDDLFHTTVNAQPTVIVESGTAGWTGNTLLGTNALSLYGDVRSRSDVGSGSSSGIKVYPLDPVDTHSIDKVIGIPGQYPQTGSINLTYITDTQQPTVGATTDVRWYEEHWSAISILSDWYNGHRYAHYPALDALPTTLTAVHIPSMFYGRQIATGSVNIWTQAWRTASGSNFGSGTRYYVDDGYGRLWDVPSGTGWLAAKLSGTGRVVGNVFYSEGLVVFTSSSANWHSEFYSASFNGGAEPHLHVEFDGLTVMKSFVFMCRLPPGSANGSNNPTYYFTASDGKRYARFPSTSSIGQNRTYITAVGIYNEERQLVAVAKLAQPIRKREVDNEDIRLKLDI